MVEMVKIRLYTGTGFAGANHEDYIEVKKDEWESLTKDEQEKELDQMALDYLWNHVECAAWVEEEE